MIRAIVFDLDGVLVDTEEYHYRSWEEAARQERLSLPRQVYESRIRGLGRIEAARMLLANQGRPEGDPAAVRLAATKNRVYQDLLRASPPRPLPGVVRLLRQLRAHGPKIGIGSASRNACMAASAAGLDPLVDVVVEGSGQPSKPAPDIFLAVAERLGVAPGECFVVEDSPTGLEAARRAGMRALAVGCRERFPGVASWVASLEEVTAGDLLALAEPSG